MNTKNRCCLQILAAAAVCLGCLSAAAGDFTIDWYIIAADGTNEASGGSFELAGTIGQPEDETVVIGGLPQCDFQLTGGFWWIVYPAVGDLNCDGQLNFDDINAFVEALQCGTCYEQDFPDCHVELADCNHDCFVDFADIDPFVELLSR